MISPLLVVASYRVLCAVNCLHRLAASRAGQPVAGALDLLAILELRHLAADHLSLARELREVVVNLRHGQLQRLGDFRLHLLAVGLQVISDRRGHRSALWKT
jgi:hypothetical protein